MINMDATTSNLLFFSTLQPKCTSVGNVTLMDRKKKRTDRLKCNFLASASMFLIASQNEQVATFDYFSFNAIGSSL